MHALGDLSDTLVAEIEHFFVSYNTIKGQQFKPTGRFDAERAIKLVEDGLKQADA